MAEPRPIIDAVQKMATYDPSSSRLQGNEKTLFDGATFDQNALVGVERIGATDLPPKDVAALTNTPLEPTTAFGNFKQKLASIIAVEPKGSVTIVENIAKQKPVAPATTPEAKPSLNPELADVLNGQAFGDIKQQLTASFAASATAVEGTAASRKSSPSLGA